MTPAVEAAKRAGIEFEILEYEHDPAHESYGLEAAEVLGVDPRAVFKTLVAEVDGDPIVAVVPVANTLDLKALAVATGAKRARMAESRAAERATGYLVGGISPLGQKRRLPMVVDESILSWATIYVSAGRRGLELALSPRDLLEVTRATTAAAIAR